MDSMRDRAHRLYQALQASICADLEAHDGGAAFGSDAWAREAGGAGLTRVLAEGAVFEKAAVNVSAVWGAAPPSLAEHLKAPSARFWAAGVSMIFHPRSPHAPTFHANLRYLETEGPDGARTGAWFGGGCDLTPYYLVEADAREFHGKLRAVCARHPVADHAAWKAWCDRYFVNTHRGEARGVGGLFFDHVGGDLERVLAFQEDLGRSLTGAYLPIVARGQARPVTPEQERWHLQRRGRYVEFNLVHDRGTRFGLQTGGRVESILVSLPSRVRFDYMAEPAPGTPEAELLALLRGPARDWT